VSKRLSENEKVVAMCLLFPLFWPFLPVILLCLAGDAIRNRYWAWRARRARQVISVNEEEERRLSGGC
jgi:hypothetical protein